MVLNFEAFGFDFVDVDDVFDVVVVVGLVDGGDLLELLLMETGDDLLSSV